MLRICTLFVLALLPAFAIAGVVPTISGTVEVSDGDSWRIGDRRLRLHGIDAPEMAQTCTRPSGQVWACGAWSTGAARRQFQGRQADCEVRAFDHYGRSVVRCRVGGVDAGAVLVTSGAAFAYPEYSADYVAAERHAAAARRGLHGSWTEKPSVYRSQRRQVAAVPATGECAIKGNLSRSGDRIYHLPGQRDYQRTRIDTARGERWFCTETAARAAGWRRARR
jgi:endonuclease YncB( thermonuclease family)